MENEQATRDATCVVAGWTNDSLGGNRINSDPFILAFSHYSHVDRYAFRESTTLAF